MNLKKLILPVSIGLASLGGYSLMTEPKIEPSIQKPQTELTEREQLNQIIEMMQPKEDAKEEEKPLMSHEAALALTALGLGGIAAIGGKKLYDNYLDGEIVSVNTENGYKDYKKNGKELKLDKEIKSSLDYVIKENNSLFNAGEGHGLYELKQEIIKKKPQDYNELAIREALAVLDNLEHLYSNGMKDKIQRQKTINRELPRLIYLVDKITSNPLVWKEQREKYPHYESDVKLDKYKEFRKKVYEYAEKCSEAKADGRIASFQQNMEEIKKLFIQYSTADSKAFAEVLECLYYFTSELAVKDFLKSSCNNDFERMRRQYVENIRKSKQLPNEKTEQKGNIDKTEVQRTQRTRRQENQNEVSKENNVGITKEVNKDINPKITFASVGGQEDAIDKLKKNIMYPLKYPEAFKNRMLNRGVILYGPPGTGKTLIALALANESNANFIKINASDLTATVHGGTEKNWRELFDKARKSQPCIIFIDEIDSILLQRGTNKAVDYDDKAQNQILALISDVEKNGDNIFIIGATNRFDKLDEAATRAGRFGTHIEITAPKTVKDAMSIFDIHTKDKKLAKDINKVVIAMKMLSIDATGSDIAAIVNNALENSYNRLGIYEKMEKGTFNNSDLDKVIITNDDLIAAIDNYRAA